MKTDLVVRLEPDQSYHTLYMGVFADDGAVVKVLVKRFPGMMKARNLRRETEDWETWPVGTAEDLAEYQRIRSMAHPAKGIP